MTTEKSPQPGRPVMTAREAARLLRKDPRTIQRMIEDGELDGGAHQGPQRRRWFVYADQFNRPSAEIAPAAQAASDVAAERDRLLLENADLRAELISTKEAYRLVLASQATMHEALTDYQRSVDELLAGTTAFRDAAAHFQAAVSGLQSSNSKLNQVAGAYSDALHQGLIPGHAGTLGNAGPNQ
ncbi:putative uncharacterized protein [Mycolicibacterium fortuitum subsp. acetamidolyticum]|nr:putative uncharacterized protein [Mycolicibacterium fortuitum subsp. acetamidolyticum]